MKGKGKKGVGKGILGGSGLIGGRGIGMRRDGKGEEKGTKGVEKRKLRKSKEKKGKG